MAAGTSPAASDLTVHVDAEELTRVLDNLVSNAVRHTASGGRVAVTMDATAHEAVVRVERHRAGQIIERDVQPAARADQVLDLGIGLRAREVRIELAMMMPAVA